MAYTRESSIKSVAKVKGVIEFVEEMTNMKITPALLMMAGNMSCAEAAMHVNWTDEQVDKVLDFANSVEE